MGKTDSTTTAVAWYVSEGTIAHEDHEARSVATSYHASGEEARIEAEEAVERMVEEYGPTVSVRVLDEDTTEWRLVDGADVVVVVAGPVLVGGPTVAIFADSAVAL